jgi:hypothetical protein
MGAEHAQFFWLGAFMPSFGKRRNGPESACILQAGSPPIWCRILEKTPRIVCLEVQNPRQIAHQFELVLNGAETVFCEVSSVRHGCVAARYSNKPFSTGKLAAMLDAADNWRSQK